MNHVSVDIWRIEPPKIDSLLSGFCHCVKFRVRVSVGRHVARGTQPKLCGWARAQWGAREGAKGGPGEAHLDLDRGIAETKEPVHYLEEYLRKGKFCEWIGGGPDPLLCGGARRCW